MVVANRTWILMKLLKKTSMDGLIVRFLQDEAGFECKFFYWTSLKSSEFGVLSLVWFPALLVRFL